MPPVATTENVDGNGHGYQGYLFIGTFSPRVALTSTDHGSTVSEIYWSVDGLSFVQCACGMWTAMCCTVSAVLMRVRDIRYLRARNFSPPSNLDMRDVVLRRIRIPLTLSNVVPRYIINLQKGGTSVWVLSLMAYYNYWGVTPFVCKSCLNHDSDARQQSNQG